MELSEQTTRLLDSDSDGADRLNSSDTLDSPDLEQNPVYKSDLLFNDRKPVQRRWLLRWPDPNWPCIIIAAILFGVVCGALGYTLNFWARQGPGPDSGRASPPDVAPLRVMIVGDSISHGLESMHTWRYRLWEWFQANDVPVVFVGPFHRTYFQPEDLATGVPWPPAPFGDKFESPTAIEGGYALDVEPEFLQSGSAHCCRWGRALAQDVDIIGQLTREYRPDYLLVELGYNDLAWGGWSAVDTLNLMKLFVERAQETNPELHVAVANIPQRGKTGDLDVRTTQYNNQLREAIPKWSRPGSPVELVEFMEAYSCGPKNCSASLDGLHPNNQGEYEIAYAFAKTLSEKSGIGQPLALPAEYPHRNCLAPASVFTYPRIEGHQQIRFAWDFVYGAYGYDVQVRRAGAEWKGSEFARDRHVDTELSNEGGTWEFRVRTNCEETVKSPWTHTVAAVLPAVLSAV